MNYLQRTPLLAVVLALVTALTGYGASPALQAIPSGTVIPIRMIDSISSDYNHPGQVFHGELAAPVRVNDRVVLPRGAHATVRLVDVRSAGRWKGRSQLVLQLDQVGGHAVHTQAIALRGSSQGKKTAKSAGIGAAIGAGAGALLGGGKGALIGGGLGAGAGAATRAYEGGKPVYLGSESVVNFRVR
jgi:hypothetical protein